MIESKGLSGQEIKCKDTTDDVQGEKEHPINCTLRHMGKEA